MPKFEVTICRDVRKIDEFKRVIEADDETDAYNIGAELARESDHDCPDDCAETGEIHLGDFYVEGAVEVHPDTEIDE